MSNTKTKNTKHEPSRYERVLAEIEAKLAQLDGTPGMPMTREAVEAIEQIEDKPYARIIADALADEHGWNVQRPEDLTPRQKYERGIDDIVDREYTTRQRNAYYRENAHKYVYLAIIPQASIPHGERMAEFVRRFYKPGDGGGTFNGIARAVTCALDWEREAERSEAALA